MRHLYMEHTQTLLQRVDEGLCGNKGSKLYDLAYHAVKLIR